MEILTPTHLWLIYESDPLDSRVSLPPLPTPAKASLAGLMTLTLGMGMGQAWANPAYVDTPVGYALNIRQGPSTSTSIVRTLRRGTRIDITGAYRNGWAQLSDGTWVAGNLIRTSGRVPRPSQPSTRPSTRAEAVVNTTSGPLNVRSGPGLGFAVVETLARGSRVIVTGRRENGWAQLNNDTWVSAEYLTIGSPQPRDSSSEPTVVRWQNRLKELGYLPANTVSTGIYDTATESAVRRFQQNNGLLVDGIVGPNTWQALNRNTAVPASGVTGVQPRPQPVANPQQQQAVVELQDMLKQLNYLPANFMANGRYDFTTQNAVRQFQQSNRLQANAVVDQITWQALYRAIAPPTLTPTPTPVASPPPTTQTTPLTVGERQQMQVVLPPGEEAFVFEGPGPEYERLRAFSNGAVVTTTGRISGNWTELADGGWVFSSWLQQM